MPREIPLVPVRVSSVFASRKEEEVDDGDTSILDKERMVSTERERKRERDIQQNSFITNFKGP